MNPVFSPSRLRDLVPILYGVAHLVRLTLFPRSKDPSTEYQALRLHQISPNIYPRKQNLK